MIEIEVKLPDGVEMEGVPAALVAVCAGRGLRITLATGAARYPGSRYWHFKRGREAGTIEITWWPGRARLWLKVSAGRGASWIEAELPALQAALEQRLAAANLLVDDTSAER